MSLIATSTTRPRPPALRVGESTLEFGDRAYIMGVVNVTPDSFSDGGRYFETDRAVDRGVELAEAGADIIDVGGESTRPGADPVAADEERDRVLPVVRRLAQRTDAWLSIDTYKSQVAAAAVDAGADIVNDISGLGFDDQMASTVADLDCGLVMMHTRDEPSTMQDDIDYNDLIEDIRGYFRRRLDRATAAGIDPQRIVLDPGIGFGKTVDHNYRLIRDLSAFTDLGHPLLMGPSRKSFIGAVVDRPPDERVRGTAATVAASIMTGADILRIHDVGQLRDVVRVAEAICGMAGPDND